MKFRLSERRNVEKFRLQNTPVIITSLLYGTCKRVIINLGDLVKKKKKKTIDALVVERI